ncbi:MAG: cyclic nucleotide-binding domain-containing protein, partial [Actinomycetota bacterium]
MKAADLRSCSLFEGLSHDDLEVVARWADEVEVPEGKHLVDEGRFAYEFFVIRAGTAEVRHGDETVRELGADDFFGEIGLLAGEGKRTATVVAASPMRLIVMSARDFSAMADH